MPKLLRGALGKKPLPTDTDFADAFPNKETKGLLVETALAAGLLLASMHAQGNWQTRQKDDNSPVTDADIAADKLIAERLSDFAKASQTQIISEETAKPSETAEPLANRLLFVDPLDGTRNFTHFGRDYCVNLGLVENRQAVFGVIADPSAKVCWWGGANLGAWRANFAPDGVLQEATALQVRPAETPLRIVLGYWSDEERVGKRLAKLGITMTTPQRVGAALKFCRIAEGVADLYPRGRGSSEWDTAAGQAILEGAGGVIRLVQLVGEEATLTEDPLRYGKEKFLNPPFFATTAEILNQAKQNTPAKKA